MNARLKFAASLQEQLQRDHFFQPRSSNPFGTLHHTIEAIKSSLSGIISGYKIIAWGKFVKNVEKRAAVFGEFEILLCAYAHQDDGLAVCPVRSLTKMSTKGLQCRLGFLRHAEHNNKGAIKYFYYAYHSTKILTKMRYLRSNSSYVS